MSEQQLRCNAECKWFQDRFTLPTDFKFLCTANNAETILQEGQSEQSLIGMWRSEASARLLDSPCIAPDQRDIIPMEDRPYGGMDPFGSLSEKDL